MALRDETKIPPIGGVPQSADTETAHHLGALKEAVEVMAGVRGSDNLDRVVRYRDLVNLGLITAAQVPTK